jgi:hypothetical protein
MAHNHTTFAGLFNDASRDPFLVNGTYKALLDSFKVDAMHNNPTPQAVHQTIAALTNQHLPVIVLGHKPETYG